MAETVPFPEVPDSTALTVEVKRSGDRAEAEFCVNMVTNRAAGSVKPRRSAVSTKRTTGAGRWWLTTCVRKNSALKSAAAR